MPEVMKTVGRYEILRDNCRAMSLGTPLRNLVDKAQWF